MYGRIAARCRRRPRAGSAGGAQQAQPGSQGSQVQVRPAGMEQQGSGSGLDAQIWSAWDVAAAQPGVFRSSFDDFAHRTCVCEEAVKDDGVGGAAGGSGGDAGEVLQQRCIHVQYNAAHWAAKRQAPNAMSTNPEVPDVPLERPVDPAGFNFTKIRDSEVLFRFNLTPPTTPLRLVPPRADGAGPDQIVVNVSPLFRGHSLVLPDPAALAPQRMQARGLEGVLRLLAQNHCSGGSTRLLFNSLGAFASVNHLHWHLVQLPVAQAPIELLPEKELARDARSGVVLAGLASTESWGTDMLTLRLPLTPPPPLHDDAFGCTRSSAGDSERPHDMAVIGAACMRLFNLLYERKIPFNVLAAPPCADAGGQVTLRIFPRQNQAVQLRSNGYKMAVAELAGFAICQSEAEWAELTFSAYMARMRETVALPNSAALLAQLVKAWVDQ
jgi:hypothetical protein